MGKPKASSVKLDPKTWGMLKRIAKARVYGDDPTEVARRFVLDGVRRIAMTGELERVTTFAATSEESSGGEGS